MNQKILVPLVPDFKKLVPKKNKRLCSCRCD
nr:MAG TPA: hypothetical protein [Caudoviricetes sp.]